MYENYRNGNAAITIHDDGTRIVQFEGELDLEFPLNVDIRISNRCSLGKNPKDGKSFCDFCHESATTDGLTGNYDNLKAILRPLPKGIELAIGANFIDTNLVKFLRWANDRGLICNLTINQLHIKRYLKDLTYLIDDNVIKGLGISLRDVTSFNNLPRKILDYKNSVAHVIVGIDEVEDVSRLDISKVLCLGYKTFGRGVEYYSDKVHQSIFRWNLKVGKLLNDNTISFDNLAIKQLEIKRFFKPEAWEQFYQGEESFYINAVDETFSPSSRSDKVVPWGDLSIRDYYQSLKLGLVEPTESI